MMPRWRKLGLTFDVRRTGQPWMATHAQVPVADHISGDAFRVYFATRRPDQVSSIGSIVIELSDDPRILEVGNDPVLEPGGMGTFEDYGVFPSCVVSTGETKRLYYIGFSRGYRAPLFYASIGLATSNDGGSTWVKHSRAPIMSRSEHDPCLVTSPHVAWHEGRYRMMYSSGFRWSDEDGELRSHYHIKYAESTDGVNWEREGRVAVELSGPQETNIARPWVIAGVGRFHMWFGYVRGDVPYRIGYATSQDYLTWARSDAASGIDVSPNGWDSDMLCYPSVVMHQNRAFMLYNGNNYGEDGFGLAVLEGYLE